MTATASKTHGEVYVHEDECKGCALCVESCPVHGLSIVHGRLNRIGYHPVQFLDCGCTGCGVCFYACPEPGALRVLRHRPSAGAEPARPQGPSLPDVVTEAPVQGAPRSLGNTADAAPSAGREEGETL